MKNFAKFVIAAMALYIGIPYRSSSKAVDCSTDTVGLCTPTIEEIIDENYHRDNTIRS
jgi:hypothetical protein